jgi:carboxypeptidase C (cathepsin A)
VIPRHACTLLTALAIMPAALAAQRPSADSKDTALKPIPAESSSVTTHTVTIDGKPIKYTARAGNLLVRNDSDDVIGSFFYVAYTRDGMDPNRRPVTFVFNGGPGSSTVWLHLGSFSPVRVVTNEPMSTPPAPYTLSDNPSSLIDRTDLVYIDAMETGFSRLAGKGKGKDFFGVDQDIRAFGDFIVRYATVYNRWNSPKYLMGESYGTTRAAGLANALQQRGMSLNGIILISSILNFYVDGPGPPNSLDLPYVLYLPTMAATAWYHHKLPTQPPALEPFLDQVKAFALGDYQQALAQGASLGTPARDSIASRMHTYTGLSTEYILSAHLRVSPSRFQKELLRGEERTAARLDARFTGIDLDAAGERPEYDAANVSIDGPFTAAFNQYVVNQLHYNPGLTYFTTNYPVVGADWDDRHRVGRGRYPIADVAEDLREVMTKNPYLRVFSAAGYYDFATPFFETDYTISHMGLDPSLTKNFTYGYYEAGHMMYLHNPILVTMKADLATFYDAGLRQ